MAKYLDLEAKVGSMSVAQLREQPETESKKDGRSIERQEEQTDGSGTREAPDRG